MNARKPYTLLVGRHARRKNGTLVKYVVGSHILLTDEESKSLGTRVTPEVVPTIEEDFLDTALPEAEVEEEVAAEIPAEKVPADDASPTTVDDWDFISSSTVPAVLKMISNLDDIDNLRVVRTAEKSGSNRVTVVRAINARIRALKAEDKE